MPYRCSVCLVLILGFLGLAGCVSDRDISNDPHFPTGFKVGAVYRIVVPTAASVYHKPFGEFIMLIGPFDGRPLPRSGKPGGLVTDYQTFEVLPVGTQIRITQIRRFYAYLDVGSETTIGAIMASGPHEGMAANIDKICRNVTYPDMSNGLLVRDPSILAEEPAKAAQ